VTPSTSRNVSTACREPLIACVTRGVVGERLLARELRVRQLALQILVDPEVLERLVGVVGDVFDPVDVEQFGVLLPQRQRTGGTGGDHVGALADRLDEVLDVRLRVPARVLQHPVREHRRARALLRGHHHLVAEVLVHPYHRLADLRRVVVGVTAVEVGDALVGVLHLCAAAGLPPLAERLGGEVRELAVARNSEDLLAEFHRTRNLRRGVRQPRHLARDGREKW